MGDSKRLQPLCRDMLGTWIRGGWEAPTESLAKDNPRALLAGARMAAATSYREHLEPPTHAGPCWGWRAMEEWPSCCSSRGQKLSWRVRSVNSSPEELTATQFTLGFFVLFPMEWEGWPRTHPREVVGAGPHMSWSFKLLVHISLDFTYKFQDIIIKNVKSVIRVLNYKHGALWVRSPVWLHWSHAHEARSVGQNM